MNGSSVIKFTNAGKRFTLQDSSNQPFRRLANYLRNKDKNRHYWALQDINLNVCPGEAITVVGSNGSGKSTLLKLISGITCLTNGHLEVNGRVGGILDLGAGFHPDLTGYENIYLQGALLGLPRRDISARMKSIEDFCELGKFLHSPVRHYSMGMFLRLAFTIAVHTDPDIVLIDEALAVGDGYFMQKCTGKLLEWKDQGKTLIYVSHVSDPVENLCERAIWIDKGSIRADGPLADVQQKYHQFQFSDLLKEDPKQARPELSAMIPYSRFGTGEVTMHNVQILDNNGKVSRIFRSGDIMEIELNAVAKQNSTAVSLYFILERPNRSVTYIDSSQHGFIYNLTKGTHCLRFKIPGLPLRPGPYMMTLGIGETGNYATMYDAHQKVYGFTVLGDEEMGESRSATGFLMLPTSIRQN